MRFRTDHNVPHRKGEGHIVFGVDPVGAGVSVRVGDGVTLFFCLRYILSASGRDLTTFAQIYHWTGHRAD